jgi:prepilin-type N-terminal cleavage/methylation domain-containing protein
MSHRSDGFTLIEIVVALSIFLVVVVGAFGMLGATNVGALGAFPTAFGVGRAAKDVTAASVYLQALQEYAASQGSAAMGPTPSTYNCTPSGGTWSCTPTLPTGLISAPQPAAQPFELQWTQLVIDVSRWNWDGGASKYSTAAASTSDNLIRVKSTLNWQAGTVQKTVTVERFIP